MVSAAAGTRPIGARRAPRPAAKSLPGPPASAPAGIGAVSGSPAAIRNGSNRQARKTRCRRDLYLGGPA